MGMGYTLFVKPLLALSAAVAVLAGVYLLPDYWPDHAAASDAILRNDTARLRTYLARGLAPEERAQWRSYLRRSLGRSSRVGVEGTQPLGPAQQSLLYYALGTCASGSALQLVEAGANVSARDQSGWTLLGRAAGCEDTTLVSAMLRLGANPSAEEPDGGTVSWEPTKLGWRPRPFGKAAAILERAGAVRR
jgi:ankyrin repeat protein